jgi:hypothetical protein
VAGCLSLAPAPLFPVIQPHGTCLWPVWWQDTRIKCCASRPNLHESHPTKPIGSVALCLRVLRGARCGSSARRDLRGGRRAIGGPTPIARYSEYAHNLNELLLLAQSTCRWTLQVLP